MGLKSLLVKGLTFFGIGSPRPPCLRATVVVSSGILRGRPRSLEPAEKFEIRKLVDQTKSSGLTSINGAALLFLLASQARKGSLTKRLRGGCLFLVRSYNNSSTQGTKKKFGNCTHIKLVFETDWNLQPEERVKAKAKE